MKKLALILAALSIALLPSSTSAKGGFTMARIAGPDWLGEIEITDPETLSQLDLGFFLELENPIASPETLGAGYLMTRGYVDRSEFVPFDRLLVFPGSPGHAYYLEIVNGSASMEGKWYRLTTDGRNAFLGVLPDHLDRGSAKATDPPISSGAVKPFPFLVTGLAALGGSIVGWVLGRRNGKELSLVVE
jgi:hypothetical protein